jgi:hypothetical protein
MKRKAGQKSRNIDPLSLIYFFSCVCRCPIQSRTISTPTSGRSTRFVEDWAKVHTASSGRGSTGTLSYFHLLLIRINKQKNIGVYCTYTRSRRFISNPYLYCTSIRLLRYIVDICNRIGKRTTLLCYRKNWLHPPPPYRQ